MVIFFFNGKNENLEPLCIADGDIKLCSTIQNSVTVPQNIKHRIPYYPGIPLLKIFQKFSKLGTLTNSFNKATIILTAKLDRDTTKTEKITGHYL